MPDLIAIKRHPYAGKSREVGDHFEARDRDAKLLIAVRKARYATDADAIEPSEPDAPEGNALTAEEPQAPSAPKRTYRRRDITAASETK